MNLSLAQIARVVVVVSLFIVYSVLAHLSTLPSMSRDYPALGVTVSLAPVFFLLGVLAWRSPRRSALPLTVLALALLLGFAWPLLAANYTWLYFIQHAGAYTALTAIFGATLGEGRTPLITQLAGMVRGTLSPLVRRYTRQVTLAWTLFFAGVALTSILLFLLAPIEAWSVFANFLTLPLAAAMFLLEYRVRLRRVPDSRDYRFLDGVRAYRKRALSSSEASAPGH